MKVLKVIVDEMPKNCVACDYWSIMKPILSCDWCNALQRETEDAQCLVRPSWCPLEVETDGWTEVSQRLPEHPNWVIACDKTGYVYPAVCHDKEWHDDIDGIPYHPITHWRYLPEAPKEVKGE